MTEVSLPPPSPRDAEVQAVVLRLVEAFAFREAAAVLNARLNEISQVRQRHIEKVFLDWRELSEDTRPDFLTYAHSRRNPEIGVERE